MNEETAVSLPRETEGSAHFTLEQKEYLAGFLEGIARRGLVSAAGINGNGSGERHQAKQMPVPPETIRGTPLADATKQERWKHEEHPLDAWDLILSHAEGNQFPDE